jgi:peptidoglycan/xylan/chitin deacetylase (PgdA/CDA1 family)
MYKILTYKNIALVSAIVSLLMIFTAVSNTFLPVISVFSEEQQEVIILMYHQVSENASLWGKSVIPMEVLKEDFEYIKNNGFNVVKIKDVIAFCNGEKDLPKKAVVITFDDGQRSFLTKVVPLLEEYNFPAVINIVGALTDLYTENGETDDRYAYLNWNDIKTLSENPLVEIGHHSYNFHSLGYRRGMGKIYGESNSAYLEIMKADIETLNKKLLSDIGEVPYIFAYPYGIKNDTLSELIKNEGFSVTLSCRESVNKLKKGEKTFELGRFNRAYGKSSDTFFSEITD